MRIQKKGHPYYYRRGEAPLGTAVAGWLAGGSRWPARRWLWAPPRTSDGYTGAVKNGGSKTQRFRFVRIISIRERGMIDMIRTNALHYISVAAL